MKKKTRDGFISFGIAMLIMAILIVLFVKTSDSQKKTRIKNCVADCIEAEAFSSEAKCTWACEHLRGL